MTGNELIDLIKKHGFCDTGIIIKDNKGREFTVEGLSATMGGQFHTVIELKEIEEQRDKWFRTREVYLDELKEKLEIYESEDYRKQWIEQSKSHDITKLDKIVANIKNTIEHLMKTYEDGEIID